MERPQQHPAAEDHQLAASSLEPCHGLRGVAFEECGVLPRERLGQRCRRHVLLDTVERLGERVRFLLGPVVREALIRRLAGEGRFRLDMRAPITSCMAGSWRWFAQPPCSKPSRGSSSARPGACITPSSVRCSMAMTLPKPYLRSPTAAKGTILGPRRVAAEPAHPVAVGILGGMSNGLRDTVALVTGASSGIGEATARARGAGGDSGRRRAPQGPA